MKFFNYQINFFNFNIKFELLLKMLNLSRISIMNIGKPTTQFKNIFTLANKFSSFLKFNSTSVKFFTGKTETGWKFTTPTMRMKSIKPIYPPPGDNLVIPSKLV